MTTRNVDEIRNPSLPLEGRPKSLSDFGRGVGAEPRLDVITFGCRLNTLESERMRTAATAAGLADAVLVNTCAVTAEAVKQARQAIRRAHRENPDRPILVSGCAAETDPASFDLPEVARLLGNAEKLTPASYDLSAGGRIMRGELAATRAIAPREPERIAGRTRAFVEIQNGCDHRCTFCVIPFGRGNSRSLPLPAVVSEIRALVEMGSAEVVLTGVDITAYGNDLAERPTLGTLVRAILRDVPELPRLRLTSIDSVEADRALLDVIAEEPRLMPYFHLSLQHGDDLILKRMKRRHSRADAVRFADEVRRLRPDAVFGADLIAGFPTETETMAENSATLIDDCGLTTLHIFPFSPRPGTPAARMPQLPAGVVKARAARLRDKAERVRHAFLDSEIGRVRTLLVENGGIGRTEQFTAVRIDAPAGSFVTTRIDGHDGRTLTGVAATQAEAA
jgi:threonylcarbamoyladenosine tRNA methylthiotransferase MtaB